MRKNGILSFAAVLCIALLMACGNNAPEKDDSAASTPAAAEQKMSESDEWTSPLGYTITYDPKAITLDDSTDGIDTYTYNTAENLDASVYVALHTNDEMDAKTLAEGLALQSGLDGVEAETASFGADGIEVYSVCYEKDENGVKMVYSFYVIPQGTGALIAEFVRDAGVPENVEQVMEDMLGSVRNIQNS